MYRMIEEKLLEWKTSHSRKPLLIEGVRQCGKTYIMQNFGNKNYDNVLYINFEKNRSIHHIFDGDLDGNVLVSELSILFKTTISPGKTLIILDEIQTCPKALTALKYFCEDAPEQHIMCAGSLPGLIIRGKNSTSFPVGKIDRLEMYPMNFPEFIIASGEKELYQYLNGPQIEENFLKAIDNKLERLYREYLTIGGMPAAVDSWVRHHDITEVDNILSKVLLDYRNDFGKYAFDDLQNLTLIWNSIPQQLARENKKFFFGHAKEGARSKDLEKALQWLVDARLVYKCTLIKRPEIPISMFEDGTYFKLYMADTGLLRIKMGYDAAQEDFNPFFKGAQAENYVCCELMSGGIQPHFWRDDRYEVDFVVQTGGHIIPIEVKAEKDRKSASLDAYRERYRPEQMILVSANEPSTRGMTYIPFWYFWKLKSLITQL